MRAAVLVDHQGDLVGDALLRLAYEQLSGTRVGPPDDAPNVVARRVLPHAVELHAARPRPRHRWADWRVLEQTRQRTVLHPFDGRVHEHFVGLAENLLSLG